MNKSDVFVIAAGRRKVLSPGQVTGKAKKPTKLSTACVGKKTGQAWEAQGGPIFRPGRVRGAAPCPCGFPMEGGFLLSPPLVRS